MAKYEIGNHQTVERTDNMVEAIVRYRIMEAGYSPCYLMNKTENNILKSHGYDPPWRETPSQEDMNKMCAAGELLVAYVNVKIARR